MELMLCTQVRNKEKSDLHYQSIIKTRKDKVSKKTCPTCKVCVNSPEKMQTLIDGKLADLPDNQTFRVNISMTVKCELPIDITDFTG